MALPPLLRQHIDHLQSQGYDIETKEGSEICIIIKDYPVPTKIWDHDKVDLLIVTHPTYPNAKLDMFWVDPPLALKSGGKIKAISLETRCGRHWQRFSWHVKNWNLAHDSIITYLNVVDDRLKRNE